MAAKPVLPSTTVLAVGPQAGRWDSGQPEYQVKEADWIWAVVQMRRVERVMRRGRKLMRDGRTCMVVPERWV